ncbi:glucans biosynthesis glucosyltransferase MdoH [Phenylobacterium montanum]|uniref:Glucans biosynthesis glucosyltransferase H n=1 Tax=Phenylobacterium montanum TaxID=2823693 RepID=A0A975FWV5_9CAUL|nr:glucans biosynthesis glucosyltransferase MdoH [Caulobacter sp. S6]QUD86407.1 glucans biosynthesis glucosyltransferase MdoH [Caulobacter sp. S6]
MNASVRRPLAFAPLSVCDPIVADLPEAAPIDMPVQSLWESARRRRRMAPGTAQGWRVAALSAITLAMTVPATAVLASGLRVDGLSVLDFALLVVFALLFAWTTFAFVSAAVGLIAVEEEAEDCLDPAEPVPTLASRTAVLVPVYNEDPRSVFVRLRAIAASIAETGQAHAFALFVLSDTTKAEIRVAEQAAFRRFKGSGTGVEAYYRHRPENIDRKAGNIADWVRVFGGAYEQMVVLDADSLMSGETLVRLAGAMERNHRLGLIQTLPTLVNLTSLFARAQQFASRLYGPMLARGTAWWSGPQGNYWGHNAILRVKAFADQAGLPHLAGRRPFGGHIMSHDFVEAALMRRAGWEVRMATKLGGSYEESPPTLADLMARDRRWCQGNLQHALVVPARGLHWVSRLHLVRGFCAYLTSPLWLALLVIGAILSVAPKLGAYQAANATAADLNHRSAALTAVFAISMGMVLAPKLMAFGVAMVRRETRVAFGGLRRALMSLLAEIGLSALIAPIMMLSQTRALADIFLGRDSGWSAQTRKEGALSFREATRRHRVDTLFGLVLAAASLSASLATFLWLSPVILGLLSAIPLAVLTSRQDLGLKALRAGLFLIPEERAPPPLIRHVSALMAWPSDFSFDAASAWLISGGKVEPMFG